MSSEGLTDSLTHAARDGDEQATERLLEMHGGLICLLAKRLCCEWIDQEELIQAGRLGFMHALRRYDPTKEAKITTYAVPWILGEMRRTIKRMERTVCSLDAPLDDDCRTLHDIIVGTQALDLGRIDLRLALSKLDNEEQLLICLRYFRDKSQKESAVLLGKSQAQISRLERRALDALHAILS